MLSRYVVRLALLSVIATVACDKVPLLAPTQSTITLSVNRTTVAAHGTAEVIATVIEQPGTAVHNGTVVTFTASVGTMEPQEARTEGGIARATFRAGTQSGTARISAFSGAAVATDVELLVGGAAASTVTLLTEPSSVPQTGGVVQVIAIVRDASGNFLPGAPVVFNADNGSLSANSALANANGEARTTLTTNRETVVRASVADKEDTFTVRAVSIPSVTITPSASPIVGAPVTFTIAASSAATANPIISASLDFGDGDPPIELGAIPPGGSVATSHVYRRANAYTVVATLHDNSGLRGTSSTVVNVQRLVPGITVTASPPSVVTGQAVTVSVSVLNPQNIPIQSVVLRFGDGSQISLSNPQSGTGQTSKVYDAPNTYMITAVLTDANGGESSSGTQVVVQSSGFGAFSEKGSGLFDVFATPAPPGGKNVE